MRPVTFLPLLLLGVLLGCLTIAAVDYGLRSLPQASDGVMERKMADALREGWQVGFVVLPNERLVRRYYLEGRFPHPQLVVLGSSRSQLIEAASWPGEAFLNLSLSGGVLEDGMALDYLLRERGVQPRQIVLCCDPWLIGTPDLINAYKANEDYYFKALEGLFRDGTLSAEILQRKQKARQAAARIKWLSFPHLRNLLNFYLADYLSSFAVFKTVQTTYHTILTTNGTMIPDDRLTGRSVEEARQLALEAVDKHGGLLALGQVQMDPQQLQLFQVWVDHLLKSGTGVTFYLSPYHPDIYPKLAGQAGNCLREAESHFRNFAAERHIPVLGSYDPAQAGVTAPDFLDGVHLRASGIQRVLNFSKP